MARISDYDDGGEPTSETEFVVARAGTTRKLNWSTIRTYLSTLYLAKGTGVTGGDSHAHSTGDGGGLSHTNLSSIGTLTHAQIDAVLETPALSTAWVYSDVAITEVSSWFGEIQLNISLGINVVKGFIWYETTAAADFWFNIQCYNLNRYTGNILYKYQGPGGVETSLNHHYVWADPSSDYDVIPITTASDGIGWIQFDGIINLLQEDNLYFYCAQLAADPGGTTLKAGSYMETYHVG